VGSDVRGLRQNRGANAIEFALTLPIFLVIFMGGMDWGWYFFIRGQVMNSTLIGCEIGSRIRPDSPVSAPDTAKKEIDTRYKKLGWKCSSLGSLCDYRITTLVHNGNPAFGEHKTLKCEGVLPFTPLTGYVLVPKSLHLKSELRMEFQK
jgi:hypothetical protein